MGTTSLIKHLTRLLALSAVALLAACSTSRDHGTAPDTQLAQACALQCRSTSDQCRAREDSAMQQCEWRKTQSQRDLDSCRANGDDPMKCQQQVPLCYMANHSQRDGQYRQCYQGCGGTVTAESTK